LIMDINNQPKNVVYPIQIERGVYMQLKALAHAQDRSLASFLRRTLRLIANQQLIERKTVVSRLGTDVAEPELDQEVGE
jgi:hypothetical protein